MTPISQRLSQSNPLSTPSDLTTNQTSLETNHAISTPLTPHQDQGGTGNNVHLMTKMKEDKSSKRQCLVESDMPWFSSSDTANSSVSNPSCGETRRLLRAYNKDISKAKFFIKISPRSPPGIPSSQWERILRGESVDLNQIFSSLHHVIPDEERTGRLGDAEISFGISEAKK